MTSIKLVVEWKLVAKAELNCKIYKSLKKKMLEKSSRCCHKSSLVSHFPHLNGVRLCRPIRTSTTERHHSASAWVRELRIEYVDWKHTPGHPSCWSIFLRSVRTNNDVEGWHNGLNTRAQGKSQLPLYFLIDLLHKEAKLTSLNVRMVLEKELRRVQRRRYRQIQSKVFSLWGDYSDGERRRDSYLRLVRRLLDREEFKINSFRPKTRSPGTLSVCYIAFVPSI